jgi:hypothetical protein
LSSKLISLSIGGPVKLLKPRPLGLCPKKLSMKTDKNLEMAIYINYTPHYMLNYNYPLANEVSKGYSNADLFTTLFIPPATKL